MALLVRTALRHRTSAPGRVAQGDTRWFSREGGHRRSSGGVGFGCEHECGEEIAADDKMALVELIEQGAASDLMREMLAFGARGSGKPKSWIAHVNAVWDC